MASWSRKRRFTYAIVAVVLPLVILVTLIFMLFYEGPTCFDGKLNGKEQGVDCGGACQKLCASAFLPPSVAWTRFEEVAPGLYNIAAYIVNPNSNAEALNVPYRLIAYDNRGILITEYNGKVTLVPQRNTVAFARVVDMGKRVPSKVSFEFTGYPDWNLKTDPLASLVIGEKTYTEDEVSSSLMVSLSNTSVHPLGPISVYAVLYDADSNAIGFSKTIVDEIPAKGSAIAPFTWPLSRDGRVISIEVLPVSE